eukprot:m.5615 g.5615  ORF g.5615 m.5615 type:complete len:446 (-) comp5070_c0_seq1:321-1658(-)
MSKGPLIRSHEWASSHDHSMMGDWPFATRSFGTSFLGDLAPASTPPTQSSTKRKAKSRPSKKAQVHPQSDAQGSSQRQTQEHVHAPQDDPFAYRQRQKQRTEMWGADMALRGELEGFDSPGQRQKHQSDVAIANDNISLFMDMTSPSSKPSARGGREMAPLVEQDPVAEKKALRRKYRSMLMERLSRSGPHSVDGTPHSRTVGLDASKMATCDICRAEVKGSRAVKVDALTYCRQDFQNLFLRSRKAMAAARSKLQQQAHTASDVLARIPEMPLKGVTFKNAQAALERFRLAKSYDGGVIMKRECAGCLSACMKEKIGPAYNEIVDEYIAWLLQNAQLKSAVIVREVEYLLLLSALFAEWSGGSLKAKSTAKRKKKRRDKRATQSMMVTPQTHTLTSPKPSRPSEAHVTSPIFDASMLPPKDATPVERTGNPFSGTGAADNWMMY